MGLQPEAQVVGIKMPGSEREGGEMLVCKGQVVSSVLGLFGGHTGLPCEVGRYKELNHWHVGIFTVLGVDELAQGAGVVLGECRLQGGTLGHPALRTVAKIVSNQHTCAWESALGLANPTDFFIRCLIE